MQSQTRNRYLACLLLVATFALSAASAISQERRPVPPTEAALPCPIPQHIHLTAQAPQAATPYLPDFPATPCSAGFEPNFGGTTRDRCFRHTFTWKPPTPCCQCLRGTLTLTYRALNPGSPNSPTSANDTFATYPGVSGPLYVPPAGGGPPWQRTKTIPLKCEWLTNHRLSFLVQDDTSVLSATLDVDYCCVKP